MRCTIFYGILASYSINVEFYFTFWCILIALFFSSAPFFFPSILFRNPCASLILFCKIKLIECHSIVFFFFNSWSLFVFQDADASFAHT